MSPSMHPLLQQLSTQLTQLESDGLYKSERIMTAATGADSDSYG